MINEQVSIDVFAKITAHNNQLIKEMESPDFDGDTKLDPTLNNGEKYIHAANEVVVSYPQGNFPLDIARNAVETTLQLLMICEMKYGKAIVKPMSQKFRRLLNLWYYNGEPTHSPEIFAREIHEAEDTLFTVMENANCKMSAALPPRTKRRGHRYGDHDPLLHEERTQVVAEMRRRKAVGKSSWTKIAASMRRDSAYSARMRGRTDATWIRYAKSP